MLVRQLVCYFKLDWNVILASICANCVDHPDGCVARCHAAWGHPSATLTMERVYVLVCDTLFEFSSVGNECHIYVLLIRHNYSAFEWRVLTIWPKSFDQMSHWPCKKLSIFLQCRLDLWSHHGSTIAAEFSNKLSCAIFCSGWYNQVPN